MNSRDLLVVLVLKKFNQHGFLNAVRLELIDFLTTIGQKNPPVFPPQQINATPFNHAAKAQNYAVFMPPHRAI